MGVFERPTCIGIKLGLSLTSWGGTRGTWFQGPGKRRHHNHPGKRDFAKMGRTAPDGNPKIEWG